MRYGKLRPTGKVLDHWQLLHEYEVTGSAITSYAVTTTINGGTINGNNDKEYKFISQINNGYAGSVNYYLRLNNETNYGYQYLRGESSTISAARSTATGLILSNGGTASGDISLSEILIYAESGYIRTAIVNMGNKIVTTTVTRIQQYGQSWNNTADNITSLNIVADQTGGLGIGTMFLLYRKVQ